MKPTKTETKSESEGLGNSVEETPEGVTLTELQAENEQLKTTIRLSQAHRQITGELAKAGARSPELLFDAVKDALQFAETGEVQNVKALVADLTRRFPEQFGVQASPLTSIDGGAGATPMPQLTREALRQMKPAEIAELDWNDVRRVLAH